MIYLEALGGVAIFCTAAGILMGILIERWNHDNESIGAEIDNYHAKGRHAASKPRRRPDKTSLVLSDTPPVNDWYEPPPGPIASHTAAVDIYPVILPEPGRYQPQPVRSTAPDTGTLEKLTTTGELVKLAGGAEEYRAQMRASNAAWLEEWSAAT